MADKYIDRGKDAPSTMLTPRTLALAQAQAEEFRKRAEAAEATVENYKSFSAGLERACADLREQRDVILTEAQAVELLRKLVADAGSQLALADGDYPVGAQISLVLSGKRPVTMPQILDLLGLEIVFRLKKDHA